MSIFSSCGFFSIVQRRDDSFLTMPARASLDLDKLRSKHMPSLSPTIAGASTDCLFRPLNSHAAFAAKLAKLGEEMDYLNFKGEVAARMEPRRAKVCSKVWDALLELEKEQ